MAFKMKGSPMYRNYGIGKSALKSAPGDHTYHEGKPKKHTHGKYAVDESSTKEERLAISRRQAADDPEGYGKTVWPGTNLLKANFNEDGTEKKKTPLKSGTHAEMKEHDGLKKHAHTQSLPNNPDGKRKNPDIKPITTPDYKPKSKIKKK